MLQRTEQSERQRVAKARAAARKRRYRARLASGGAVLAAPTRDINKLIDALATLRWLDISVSEERKQLARQPARCSMTGGAPEQRPGGHRAGTTIPQAHPG